jgi:Tfp pilus assembly protein PilO
MLGSRRAPLFVAIGVVALSLLLILFLVLPKMGQVSEAEDERAQTQSEQTALLSEKEALEDAKARAPEYRAIIEEVQQRIPPVADEAGLLLLLQNAATAAGLDVATISPATPTFDADAGLSAISVGVSASGSYFEITEFMYEIETLPRAAKATGVSITPSDTSGTVPTLQLSTTVLLYTSDTSAGPGSAPGPTGTGSEG